MSRRETKNQSTYSGKRRANKSGFNVEGLTKTLEDRLFKASCFHLEERKNDERDVGKQLKIHKKVNKHFQGLLEALNELVPYGLDCLENDFSAPEECEYFEERRMPIADLEILWMDLQTRQSVLEDLTGKNSVGRPALMKDLSLLIFSALESVKGNGAAVKAIGTVIAVNGPLYKKVVRRYGIGAFDELKLPALHVDNLENDWASGIRKSLRRQARDYVTNDGGRREILGAKRSRQELDREFKNAVKAGGFSHIEKLEEIAKNRSELSEDGKYFAEEMDKLRSRSSKPLPRKFIRPGY